MINKKNNSKPFKKQRFHNTKREVSEEKDTFLKDLKENSKYEPVAERLELSKHFVSFVQLFAAYFEYDLTVKEQEHSIIAIIEIEVMSLSGPCKRDFMTLFEMADDMALFPGSDSGVVMLLTFYTHQHYLNGKPMREM